MDIKKEATAAFNDALGVLKLENSAIERVQKGKTATRNALIFLIAPSVLNMLIVSLTWGRFTSFIVQSYLMTPAIIVLSIFVIHLVAQKFFKGKGVFIEFLRVIGYVNILQFIGVAFVLLASLRIDIFAGLVGLVSLAAGIYSLVLAYRLLIKLYKLKSNDAIYTIVIAVVVMLIVNMLLSRFWFSYYGSGYYEHEAEEIVREMMRGR